jgi:CCR4-NOT transcription complex subunit 7/8
MSGFQGMNGGMIFHPGQARHGDGPSTPTSHPAGLATTPGPSGHGMMTPGAGGTFGGYGGK